jgi:lipopolysaccharide/colanic/teichoic acid biosynthesis glycosyltransferase
VKPVSAQVNQGSTWINPWINLVLPKDQPGLTMYQQHRLTKDQPGLTLYQHRSTKDQPRSTLNQPGLTKDQPGLTPESTQVYQGST